MVPRRLPALRRVSSAASAWQDLPPLPIDENQADFLNLFVDVKLAELGGSPAYVRVGRQELLFGSQRLISPLDWANTRRTFQGVRAFRTTEKWDFDLFWVQPVSSNPARLDSVDNNQNFAGAWATYRPKKGQAIDAYYLMLDNTNRVAQQGIAAGNFTRHTFGGRYAGDEDGFLCDFEGAMQLGSQDGQDVVAGMATAGAGYHLKDAPLEPDRLGVLRLRQRGQPARTPGPSHTFNQLFPFGHYYLGWIDQVGRQNIHDLNFHLYLYPTKWLTTWLQFHSFWLASEPGRPVQRGRDRDPPRPDRAGRHPRRRGGGRGAELPPDEARRPADRVPLPVGRGVPAEHQRSERGPRLWLLFRADELQVVTLTAARRIRPG